jgi:hypothetical protein
MAINFLNTVAVDDSVLFVDTINDRVGIGTDSPDYLLDLYKSTATTSSSTGTTLQRLWNYVGSDLNQQKTFVDFVFQDDNDNEYPQVRIGAEVGQNGDSNTQPKEGSGAFVVYTNNATGNGPGTPTGLAERFRVDYRGNVGIGTDNPQTELHVKGNNGWGEVRIEGQTLASGHGASVEFYSEGTSLADLYANTNKELVFRTNGTTEQMRITSGGNVGIGTTSPNGKLQFSNDVETRKIVLWEGYDNDYQFYGFGIESSTLVYTTYGAGDDHVFFVGASATSRNELMRIKSTGKVGIGTDDPSEKLEVDGNIKIKNALLSNQENTDVDTGAEVVAQVAHATYTAAFFDFVVKKGTNVRSGTVYACHNGDSTPLVEFTETSTNDLGDTSDVTLSVDISGANMRLVATVASDDWSVKSLIRAI